jgi:PAS domain S-box-containing protein
LAAIHDVTELKVAVSEREMLSQVTQNVLHAVIVTDLNGVIRYVNPAFERLYGFREREVVGQRPSILNPGRDAYLDLGYPDSRYDELFSGLWKDISDPAIVSWEGSVVNRAKDGSLMRVRLTISAIRSVEGRITGYIAIPFDVTKQYREEQEVRIRLYRAIASVAEMRDNETGKHMVRVGVFSRMLALELGLPDKFADEIEIFAPLHDIGKVGIRDDILRVARVLSPEEFSIMKEHTTFGHNLLMNIPELAMADEIAHGHHERFDGKGYPGGLEGDSIPMSARIAAVADVYDALRSLRPYKSAQSHGEAAAAIVAGAGTHFDPAVVVAFVKIVDEIRAVFEDPVYSDG